MRATPARRRAHRRHRRAGIILLNCRNSETCNMKQKTPFHDHLEYLPSQNPLSACNDSPSPNGVPIPTQRAFRFVLRLVSFCVSSYTTWVAQSHVCVGSVPSMATPTLFVIRRVIHF